MLDSYRDLIDELLGTPTMVRVLVGERTTLPAEAAALITGLRDRDQAVLARVQAMLRGPSTLLSPLGDAPGGEAKVDAATLLAGLDTARGELVSLLMNLTLKDWERTATHAVDGEITLAEEVERHVDFDEERRRELTNVLSA